MNKGLDALQDLFNYIFQLKDLEDGTYARKVAIEFGIEIENELTYDEINNCLKSLSSLWNNKSYVQNYIDEDNVRDIE